MQPKINEKVEGRRGKGRKGKGKERKREDRRGEGRKGEERKVVGRQGKGREGKGWESQAEQRELMKARFVESKQNPTFRTDLKVLVRVRFCHVQSAFLRSGGESQDPRVSI